MDARVALSSREAPFRGRGARTPPRTMSPNAEPPSTDHERAPIPVVAHLSGARRGVTERLRGEILRIGTAADAEIRLSPTDPSAAERHALLRRRGQTYELVVEPGREVWVNGELVESLVLASGDVLEVGRDGPVIRFRLYPAGSRAYKSMSEAFSDGLDCARLEKGTGLRRAGRLLTAAPRELVTQTSPRFRTSVAAIAVLLVLSVGALSVQGLLLERRLAGERERWSGIAEMLERAEDQALTREELAAAEAGLEARLDALEARSAAARQVIASASRATVFLQGSWGFQEEASGRFLRFHGLGPGGVPLRGPEGEPLVGVDGGGPPVELRFTGTAFVAGSDGLLITNRHVAQPWVYDPAAKRLGGGGFRPAMQRFVGYLPGAEEPFEVELVRIHERTDVALLRSSGAAARAAPLPLATTPPAPGDEVIVLGYPTGIRALLARADSEFVAEMSGDGELDFWEVVRGLAQGGYIAPLASRGIVAQVTPAAVVYDAETTRGGSGGPVLDLKGRVVAVSVAILPEFGGSNLGIPAAAARQLVQLEEEG